MINTILDPVLGPLLLLDPLLSIIVIAFIISLLITLAYKFLTNQSLMKDLREEQKIMQKKIKELKNNPDKAMKVQSEMMETNLKYMTHSMRPTLFTFLPIILIFGWLNSHMAYYPLMPNQAFEVIVEAKEGVTGDVSLTLPDGVEFVNTEATKEIVNQKASWFIKGDAGEYMLKLQYGEEEYEKPILITNERRYESPEKDIKNSPIEKIIVGNEKIRPLEGLPLVGNWGWLGIYIIFSIVFSMSMRRILKIY